MAETHTALRALVGEAPCDGCPSEPTCRTHEVACKAFSKYVSTGTFCEADRGDPIPQWFHWALRQ